MIGWTITLMILWIIFTFGNAPDKVTASKKSLYWSILTICLTIIFVWGEF